MRVRPLDNNHYLKSSECTHSLPDKDKRGNEAILLDMGEFMLKPPICDDLPEILSAKDFDDFWPQGTPRGSAGGTPITAGGGNKVAPEPTAEDVTVRPLRQTLEVSSALPGRSLSPHLSGSKSAASTRAFQRFKLYQILSPRMAHRGRIFGSKLVLKDEWAQVDVPYFLAPGDLSTMIRI